MKSLALCVVISAVFASAIGCKPKTTDGRSQPGGGEVLGIFGSSVEKVKLKDGTSVVAKDYKLDEKVKAKLEEFIDSDQALYTDIGVEARLSMVASSVSNRWVG